MKAMVHAFALALILLPKQAPEEHRIEIGKGVTVAGPADAKTFQSHLEGEILNGWEWTQDGRRCIVYAVRRKEKGPIPSDLDIAGFLSGATGSNPDLILQQSDVLVNGWWASRQTTKMPSGRNLRFELVWIAPTLYAFGYYAQKTDTFAEADRFLDSFAVEASVGKGLLTHPGAEFQSFPLEHGVWALFPRKPEFEETHDAIDGAYYAIANYHVQYMNRAFNLHICQLRPADIKNPANRKSIVEQLEEDFLIAYATGSRKPILRNGKPVTRYDFTLGRGLVGWGLSWLQGNIWVAVGEVGPPIFANSDEMNTFMHSVRFGKATERR